VDDDSRIAWTGERGRDEVIRLAVRRTCSAIGQQRVESVERVCRAGDITVTPELLRGQLQHLTEDLGTPQLAGECQRGQPGRVHDSVASWQLGVSQGIAEHILRQIMVPSGRSVWNWLKLNRRYQKSRDSRGECWDKRDSTEIY